MYQNKCKKSKECDKGDVCDRKEHMCRTSRAIVPVMKSVLAKECLKKGIPIVFERGEHKGERKTRDAMRRCKTQKDRTVIPVTSSNIRMLPAPSLRTETLSAARAHVSMASSAEFVRPTANELKNMRKDFLVRIFKEGQKKGYIDPSKAGEDLTNKQLINMISRATQRKW